jgi:hypothetical protein
MERSEMRGRSRAGIGRTRISLRSIRATDEGLRYSSGASAIGS